MSAPGRVPVVIDRGQISAYLGTLWLFPEDAPDEAHLVVWEKQTKTSRGASSTGASSPSAAAIAALAPVTDVYLGVSAKDGAAVPGAARRHRGITATALLLPALFVDLDVAGPGHASTALPPHHHPRRRWGRTSRCPPRCSSPQAGASTATGASRRPSTSPSRGRGR